VLIDIACTGRCKSNYHAITTTKHGLRNWKEWVERSYECFQDSSMSNVSSNVDKGQYHVYIICIRGRRGRDRMVVVNPITYPISAYHNWCCEFESRSGRGVQHYMIKFVMDLWQVGGIPGPPVSSTNKTDRHGITEILLKVALNTIMQSIRIFLCSEKMAWNITFHGLGLSNRMRGVGGKNRFFCVFIMYILPHCWCIAKFKIKLFCTIKLYTFISVMQTWTWCM